jgi:hypothetical protein
MLVSHTLELLPGNLQPHQWPVINGVLLLTKAATPLFVFVFGMTSGFVYTPRLAQPDGRRMVRNRLLQRALAVFLSFEFLVVIVETAEGAGISEIVGRLLYIRPGFWIGVLNYYLVILLVGVWVLRGWKRMSLWSKALLLPALYWSGVAISYVEVPELLVGIKNIVAGYPPVEGDSVRLDTFPVMQLSSFFLAGLWFGDELFARRTAGSHARFLNRTLVLSIAGFAVSWLISADPLREYLKNMALDRYRFPPEIPYVVFGLSSVFILSALNVRLNAPGGRFRLAMRWLELFGRNSLMTFNLHYVVLFTGYGLGLGMIRAQSLGATLMHAGVVVAVCTGAVWLWEHYGRR